MAEPLIRRLRSLAAVIIVVAATFVKVFPFSGHLTAVILLILITRRKQPGRLQTWFSRVPAAHIVSGACICVVVLTATDLALLKLLPHLGLQMPDFRRFTGLRGNAVATAEWVAAVWLLVAPSEELISRAFLIDQWCSILEGTRNAAVLAVFASSLTFGLVHFYEGLPGVIMNVSAAILLGTLYLQQRRRLWASILAHGTVDTLAMIAFFTGLL